MKPNKSNNKKNSWRKNRLLSAKEYKNNKNEDETDERKKY